MKTKRYQCVAILIVSGAVATAAVGQDGPSGRAVGACCYQTMTIQPDPNDPNAPYVLVTESCDLKTELECGALHGTYLGDSTTCDANSCLPPARGACCTDPDPDDPNNPLFCEFLTAAECTAVSGSYQGDGTDCDPGRCGPAPTGACCDPNNACTTQTAADCSDSGGSYAGDGTGCDPNTCPLSTGACCYQTMTTQADPNYLDDPYVVVTETCDVLTELACDELHGRYLGDGTVCDPNDPSQCWPVARGACCMDPDPNDPNNPLLCEFLTGAECTAVSGSYQGDGTDCDPGVCDSAPTGACCDPNNACTTQTAADCSDSGGSYAGDGTVCDPNPCPLAIGACCYQTVSVEPDPSDPNAPLVVVTESCDDTITEFVCGALHGRYLGDGTTCDPNSCLPPARGACCEGSVCEFLTALECAAVNGAYKGDGTDCDPNPCIGACCYPDGACAVLDPGSCTGNYLGDMTTCTPTNPCPQPGACCVGGTCTVTLQSQCSGTWKGDGTTCAPNPCGCKGDSSCDGKVTWRDIDFFVAAMNDNVSAWWTKFPAPGPACPFSNNDIGGAGGTLAPDGHVTWRDINGFIYLMNWTCPHP